MHFHPPLLRAQMIRRYKRFLVDVTLASGETVTAHCPNPGSMQACQGEGWPVLLSHSDNPKRKLPYTLEMVHNGHCWIGIHTGRANALVREAIEAGTITELDGYEHITGEVRYGANSRIDLLLEGTRGRCYVEVKNTTLVDGAGAFMFPDAVTTRGRKHLRELTDMVAQGHRAVVVFLVQRADGEYFRPAHEIDPAFADALGAAAADGVEILAYCAEVTPTGIQVVAAVPCRIAQGLQDRSSHSSA